MKFKFLTLLFSFVLCTAKAFSTGNSRHLINNEDTIKKIQISEPNQKSKWRPGHEAAIRWKANFTDSIKIELYQQDNFLGVIDYKVANFNEREGTEYIWKLPADLPVGNTYKLKISMANNPDIHTYSEVFVVHSPKTSRVLLIGLGVIVFGAIGIVLGSALKKRDNSLPEPPPDPDK